MTAPKVTARTAAPKPAPVGSEVIGPPLPSEPGADLRVASAERALLEALRDAARAAQRGPRMDLDAANATLGEGPLAQAAHAATLMRALDGAALRPLTFHPRGALAVAFGEAWTLRLVASLRDGDAASAHFLIGRAVRRERRRLVWRLALLLAESVRAGNLQPPNLESFQVGCPAQPARRQETA